MRSRTHRPIEMVARELRQSAHDASVEIPLSYARKLVKSSYELDTELSLGKLGKGIVIKSLPTSSKELPLIIGYADKRGQWYRDGRRHILDASESLPTISSVVEL